MPFTQEDLRGRSEDFWTGAFLNEKGRYPQPTGYSEELVSDLVSPQLKPALPVPLPTIASTAPRRSSLRPVLASGAQKKTKQVHFDMFRRRSTTNTDPRAPTQKEIQRLQQSEMKWRHEAILLNNALRRSSTPAPAPSVSSFPGAYALQRQYAASTRSTPVQYVHGWPGPYADTRALNIALWHAQQQEHQRRQQQPVVHPWGSRSLHKPRTVFLPTRSREEAYALPVIQPVYHPEHSQPWFTPAPTPLRQKLVFGSDDPPDPLSLRSAHPVRYDGQWYSTAQHLLFFLRLEPGLHAPGVLKDFMELPNPQVAAGRHPGALRSDWWTRPSLRWETVRLVVRTKLEQHEHVRRQLWKTGSKELCDGEDGGRENLVGKALMEYRKEMQYWPARTRA
ncbi:hypothetical protein CALVIDRAFT_556375 [Calocera viscosa TUFC12733]|uniref:Uncharacterized protein n=1 Tax=Calocera viscosa (strain TUFC12733) TaxID=1330018 RepID=A0A167K6Q9_CALVF|nr:hypothetical protein CALVIDRAFT_556375 [Calocera viscosa TUFC12733]